jgi:hypothetical protein
MSKYKIIATVLACVIVFFSFARIGLNFQKFKNLDLETIKLEIQEKRIESEISDINFNNSINNQIAAAKGAISELDFIQTKKLEYKPIETSFSKNNNKIKFPKSEIAKAEKTKRKGFFQRLKTAVNKIITKKKTSKTDSTIKVSSDSTGTRK